jgi:glycosyltransferase involved in cell wall biosynthesis
MRLYIFLEETDGMEIPENEMPFVSVIVVTLNRRRQLEKCLNSLLNLDYPTARFEVIVVDGGSDDGTIDMVCRKFQRVKLVVERRKGIVYARNTGWKHAKGTIVAYTDDDCVVDRFWLRNLISGFTLPEIKGAGGPLLYLNPELNPQRFQGTPVGPFSLGDTRRLLMRHENLITANLAVRSEVFAKVRFLESLVYNDSEDADFCRSLIEAGYKLLYIPNAKVYHDIDPKRLSIPYLIKRAFFSGISFYIMERKRKAQLLSIPIYLRYLFGGLFYFFLKRRMSDFYWLVKCLIILLCSVFLISLDIAHNSQ